MTAQPPANFVAIQMQKQRKKHVYTHNCTERKCEWNSQQVNETCLGIVLCVTSL